MFLIYVHQDGKQIVEEHGYMRSALSLLRSDGVYFYGFYVPEDEAESLLVQLGDIHAFVGSTVIGGWE